MGLIAWPSKEHPAHSKHKRPRDFKIGCGARDEMQGCSVTMQFVPREDMGRRLQKRVCVGRSSTIWRSIINLLMMGGEAARKALGIVLSAGPLQADSA